MLTVHLETQLKRNIGIDVGFQFRKFSFSYMLEFMHNHVGSGETFAFTSYSLWNILRKQDVGYYKR